MRFLFLTATVALLTGCGNTLDFDPRDDLGTGLDGSGHGDAGTMMDASADLGGDGGTSGDLGLRMDGGTGDGATGDGATGDGATRSCTSSSECSGPGETYCAFPDGVCGGTGTCATVPGTCSALDMPVCGCDDNTYVNACEAARASVSISAPGPCGRDAGVVDGGGLDIGITDPCGAIASLPRGCTGDTSCTFGIHQTDCCGDTAAVGINHSAIAEFDALEAACDATYPMCGCPTGPTTTDSGETTFDTSTIQVACVSSGGVGTCMTFVTTRPTGG